MDMFTICLNNIWENVEQDLNDYFTLIIKIIYYCKTEI
jgi:hypothetical protein